MLWKAGLTALAFGCLAVSPSLMGQPQQDRHADTQATQPDNTKVNQRDRDRGQPTADQQKENASDRDMAKNVRRAIMKDKTLSTYAHNVKVIAENGSVTLKGPVRSEEERKAIRDKAAEIAGHENIKDELQVTSSDADRSKNR